MARRTRIRDAKTAEDYRDAVVERWKRIWRQAPAPADGEKVDEPRTALSSRDSRDVERPGRFGFNFGRRGVFNHDRDDDE